MKELKITGGELNSRKISFQESEFLRPTLSKTREAVFNVLANYIDFGSATFLDAFSGSGIMSFEAVSRGFNEVFCVDANRKSIELIKQNAKLLSVNITPILGKMPLILKKHFFENRQFNVIYIDPPYASELYIPTIQGLVDADIPANKGIIVTESLTNINIEIKSLKLLKQKDYSGKLVTFWQKD